MRRIILLTSFFTITPVFLVICSLYISFISYNYKAQNGLLAKDYGHKIAFAALPATENVIDSHVLSKDARVEKVRQFFRDYNSSLEPFAQNVVNSADKYNLDYRLIPAIAMQESNLCKKIIFKSYNCWGFGIYGTKVTKFDNYPQAIETVTKTLAHNYIAGGLITPEQIMAKYTPSNDGSWAASVNYFMNLLQ
jgi:hypothetical protein